MQTLETMNLRELSTEELYRRAVQVKPEEEKRGSAFAIQRSLACKELIRQIPLSRTYIQEGRIVWLAHTKLHGQNLWEACTLLLEDLGADTGNGARMELYMDVKKKMREAYCAADNAASEEVYGPAGTEIPLAVGGTRQELYRAAHESANMTVKILDLAGALDDEPKTLDDDEPSIIAQLVDEENDIVPKGSTRVDYQKFIEWYEAATNCGELPEIISRLRSTVMLNAIMRKTDDPTIIVNCVERFAHLEESQKLQYAQGFCYNACEELARLSALEDEMLTLPGKALYIMINIFTKLGVTDIYGGAVKVAMKSFARGKKIDWYVCLTPRRL